ncbi:hypothetical protein L8P89_00490 [Enterobacter roggenkampii]|uniref:tail fiber/spike domain-containing protein n=1 Tax=Enterobacter roggenkampii TaxID=1812935 RepID=UPI002003B4EE|nr:hypothetical protein [Enterobacter roggenkampii]MCK7073769.1 hypothetical protein [Enterobacter roggenkampii]HCM9501965.1 hypothetical protein [Enterobacter roggenkampii]
MTVSTEVSHNEYTGNGVTTAFPYTFRIFKKTDLVVQTVDTSNNTNTLTVDVDYTVTGAGGYAGGNVVLSTALANGWKIGISRKLPAVQETDLRNQGKFFAEVHEDAFDYLTMLVQQAFAANQLALTKPTSVATYYDAKNQFIRNLITPLLGSDAANKDYVDDLVAYLMQTVNQIMDNLVNGLYGYNTKKSFELGNTLNYPNDVLLQESSGEWFRWDGTLPKVVPAGSTPETTGGVGEGKWLSVGDATLRGNLISSANGMGDALIAVKKSAAGTVSRTQHDVNNDGFYVEDFGAVGDGVAIDTPAVVAMISALGYARFQAKRYNLTGWQFTGARLALIGTKAPEYFVGALLNGTVLIGMKNHSVTDAYLSDLGHVGITDGIVINSGVGGANAGSLYVNNVIGVGTGESGSSHAQLYQGFNNVRIDRVEGNDSQYGVVVKSRRGFINNVTLRNTRTAGLFIKGDTGAPSGDVANGAAANILIDGVNSINTIANTGCSALFIQSSTDLVSKIIASKVRSIYGKTGLELAGGGTGALQTNSVIVSDIIAEATASSGILVTGNASDFIIQKVISINPANGSGFTIQGSAINGMISDVNLIISDATITSALAGFIDGTAMKLGPVMVRNPYRKMAVQIGRGKVNPGTLVGDVSYSGDGNIAILNGAAWGATVPSIETREGNAAIFHGSILTTGVTVAASPIIGTLPFAYPVSTIVEVSIKLRDGSYGATRLYLSGTVMQLLTSSGTSIAEVYLEGVTVNMPKV